MVLLIQFLLYQDIIVFQVRNKTLPSPQDLLPGTGEGKHIYWAPHNLALAEFCAL